MKNENRVMDLFGLLIVVSIVTSGFLKELNAKKDKPSAEEALGKAIGQYLESGIKIKVASKD